MVRYGLIDGSKSGVLKIVIDDKKKQVKLYLWDYTAKKWKVAPSEYSAIFIGEIQLTYIEEGDATWKRLGLQN